ncbi:Triacylglycerol lipase 2 [Carex littledalei]|uniref:Triacylglycerol lipase 2 n=1 Tax=Carex littledalei TaxID=544730 RepID=A0A833RI37_9POAL|nr:Triacylglycerol lipase 2 [Carex littledalei]
MKRYGQSTPPVYQLSNILRRQGICCCLLHDRDKLTVHFVKDYAHADFVMGVSAKQLVYESVIAFFDQN